VYDKFHIMQHANQAVDEVRRVEFFPQGRADAGSGKGETLGAVNALGEPERPQEAAAERVVPDEPQGDEGVFIEGKPGSALAVQLTRALYCGTYEPGRIKLPWQRMPPFEKLARMLWNHLDGILNYCWVKPPLGMVEAINGISKCWSDVAAGIRIFTTYCSKRSVWPPPRPNSSFSGKPLKMGTWSDSCSEPKKVWHLRMSAWRKCVAS
jgi:hypothetical protein